MLNRGNVAKQFARNRADPERYSKYSKFPVCRDKPKVKLERKHFLYLTFHRARNFSTFLRQRQVAYDIPRFPEDIKQTYKFSRRYIFLSSISVVGTNTHPRTRLSAKIVIKSRQKCRLIPSTFHIIVFHIISINSYISIF